jgi:hypothetical protein
MGTPHKRPDDSGRLGKVFFDIAVTFFVGCTVSSPAHAYRPFNGTDAAVADVGELEFELQPAGVLQEGGTQTLVAPWLVTNFGFAKNGRQSSKARYKPRSRPMSRHVSPTPVFL